MKTGKKVIGVFQGIYGILFLIPNIPWIIFYYLLDRKINPTEPRNKIQKVETNSNKVDFHGYDFYEVESLGCYSTYQEFDKKDWIWNELNSGFIYQNITMIGKGLDYQLISEQNVERIQISAKGVVLGYLPSSLFELLRNNGVKIVKVTAGASNGNSNFLLRGVLIYVDPIIEQLSSTY